MTIPVKAKNALGHEIEFHISILYLNAGMYKRLVATILDSSLPIIWGMQENGVGFIQGNTYTFRIFEFERQHLHPFNVYLKVPASTSFDRYFFKIDCTLEELIASHE